MLHSNLRPAPLKYQRVKDYLLGQLAAGHLRPGDALPTEKALSQKLGMGRHTVRQALAELTAAGWIERVQGRGTFVRAHGPHRPATRLDVLALVVPEVRGSLYPSLIKGFGDAARSQALQVMVCESSVDDARVQGDIILQLIHKKVSGVAIVPPVDPTPPYHAQSLQSHGIPTVFCHRRPEGALAPLITWPWEAVGRMAAERLLELGHRRIGFVSVGRYIVSEGYLRGLRDRLCDDGVELGDDAIVWHRKLASPPAEDDAHKALSQLFGRDDRPTAVFCSDGIEAERVYLEAMQWGFRIPDDLSIIGFGGAWREGVLSQRLATVTIDEMELGHRAARLLEEMRTGRRPMENDEEIILPLRFTEGVSLGPPSQR